MTNYNKTKTNYIYTLKDLVEVNNEDYLTTTRPFVIHVDTLAWENDADANIIDILSHPLIVELWREYIVPKYLNSIVAISDKELIPNMTASYSYVFGKFWRLVEFKMSSTFERYSELITIYKDNKGRLTRQLDTLTKTFSAYNETPQTVVEDMFDTKYANNTNRVEVQNSYDVGTIMSRINEIDMSLKDLYNDWAMEFDSLFIPNMED